MTKSAPMVSLAVTGDDEVGDLLGLILLERADPRLATPRPG
jgi:hypothetical protein